MYTLRHLMRNKFNLRLKNYGAWYKAKTNCSFQDIFSQSFLQVTQINAEFETASRIKVEKKNP